MSVVWRDWDPAGVKKVLMGGLERNMEVACKWVEGRARANLHAISDPKWGYGYRQKVLSRRLTYVVRSRPNVVEGRVGIKRGKHRVYHGAYYIEIGTRKFPPHPWLRPAVFGSGREIVRILEGR